MTIEDDLLAWLRTRYAEEEQARNRAAAAHNMSTYNRKVGAIETLQAVRAFIDPMGSTSLDHDGGGTS